MAQTGLTMHARAVKERQERVREARREILAYAAERHVALSGYDITETTHGFTVCGVDAFAFIDAAAQDDVVAVTEWTPARSSYARMGV